MDFSYPFIIYLITIVLPILLHFYYIGKIQMSTNKPGYNQSLDELRDKLNDLGSYIRSALMSSIF